MVSDDRSQIVLVGAVVIAFIVVGIVLVFNGVVFTETVGDQGTVVDSKEGGSVTLGAEQNIGEAAHTVNTEAKYPGEESISDRNDELENHAEEAAPYVSTAEAEAGGNFVNVSFQSVEEEGYRIYQSETANLTSNENQVTGTEIETWGFIRQDTSFDRFVLQIDAEESTGTARLVTYDSFDDSNVPPDPVNIDIDEFIEIEESGDTISLDGAIQQSSGECENIEPNESGHVTLQITRGFVLEAPGCRFTFPDQETGDQGMGFLQGEDVYGTYDLVVADEPEEFIRDEYLVDAGDSEETDQPNLSEIIWTAEYRFVYDAGQVNSTAEKEVDHYG